MLVLLSKPINNALFPTLVTTLPEYALPTPDRRLSKSKLKNGCITPSTAYPHNTTGPTNPPRYIPRAPTSAPAPAALVGPSASLAAGLSLAASVALGGSARSGFEATPAVDADHGESGSHRRRRRGRPHAGGKVQKGAGHPASALRAADGASARCRGAFADKTTELSDVLSTRSATKLTSARSTGLPTQAR